MFLIAETNSVGKYCLCILKELKKMFELDQISNELSGYNEKLEEMGNLL